MNFQSHLYYQILLQQASTSSLLPLQKRLQSSQNTLMTPPFSAVPNREFFGHKRPHEYLEESSKDEDAPIKKIKMDSYNMLFKPDLSESDPYYSKTNSAESSPSARKATVSYKQLNDQIATDKRITINFSTKSKPTKMRLPPLNFNTNPAEHSQAFPLAQGYAPVNASNRVCIKDQRVSLYDLVCKKLEENCYTLMNQMQGLVALSQDLRKEKLGIPTLNFNLAETQPGTPNSTTHGNLYEIKFNTMTEAKEKGTKRNSLEDISPKSL